MMRLRLCLFVFAVTLVSAITRLPSDSLDPVLLEATADAEQVTCTLTLSTAGACNAPTPSTGWRCGVNCEANTTNPGWCIANGTATNTYYSKPNCACSGVCPTAATYKTEGCRTAKQCSCVSGTTVVTCSMNNLCAGKPCQTASYPLPTCPLGEWTSWSACIDPATFGPVQCIYDYGGIRGVGVKSRYRDPIRSSSCTGGVRETQSQQCEADCPAEDCQQSAWETLQACPLCWNRVTDPMIPPKEQKVSAILSRALFGGADCRDCMYDMGYQCVQETDCNVPVCPTDCEVSEWSKWCECDKSCVDTRSDCKNCVGLQYRVREVLVRPSNGGKACPELRETQSCNEQPCPIDCQLSTWTPWTQCTSKCGGGQQTRTRYILLSAQYNGTACEDLFESKTCNSDACPVACEVGPWGEWDLACPACLPEGSSPVVRTKRRSIVRNPSNDGAECPPLEVTEQCPLRYCPIDCQYTAWTDWSDCTASCGGGVSTRRRTILRPASYGGTECSQPLFDSRQCNTDECPRDCIYFWGPYRSPDGSNLDCSAPCGGGMQQREIQIIVEPNSRGKQCPPSPQTQPCNTFCCPQDCLVSDYDRSIEACQSAEHCPSKCDIGFCARYRNVTRAPSCGGAACPPLTDWVPCKVRDCEETCLWSEWSGWSACPSCGETSPDQMRFREKKLLQGKIEVCGGDQAGLTYESEPCPLVPCPVNCEMDEWVSQPCSVSCGVGVVLKTRAYRTRPAFGGTRCPYDRVYEPCIQPACVPDCLLSDWSSWGPCSATCQPANAALPYQSRTRTILIQGEGEDCQGSAPLTETQTCNAVPCPLHCVLSEWSQWSPSPCGFVGGVQRCGLNLQTRSRDIIQEPANGGRICQIREDQQYCDAGPCEHPCEFTPWSEWSFPSATCGTAYRTRHRYLMNAPGDTTNCPHLSERVPATGVPECPVDCEFYYGDWSDCSAQGYRRRHVIVTRQAAFGGRKCPDCQVERDDCTPPPSGVEECWLENCDE